MSRVKGESIMRRLKLIGVFAIAVVMYTGFANAAEKIGPQELVETVTAKVLAVLKEFKSKEKSEPEFLDKKIEELILTQMDFEAMSKLVLGKHWRNASDDQRSRFVDQFRTLLVRTYKTSLIEYTDEKVEFLPFREGDEPDKRAIVKSEIVRSNGPSVPITYSLRYKAEDGWKVYDIGIEGVSLVTNYRSSFSRDITQNGIDHLITNLVEKNASGAEVTE